MLQRLEKWGVIAPKWSEKINFVSNIHSKDKKELKEQMFENLKGKQVILASGSPRRQELLRCMGIDFIVRVKEDIEESYPKDLSAKEVPEYIAREKAQAYADELTDNDVLITADTVVVLDKKILGKPADAQEAKAMLKALSGNEHKVLTGVAITTKRGQVSFTVKTKVTMRVLTQETIDHYVETYNPTDKAGAYGIQEWIGLVAIDRIEGSFQNVMGLPTQRLYAELRALPE